MELPTNEEVQFAKNALWTAFYRNRVDDLEARLAWTEQTLGVWKRMSAGFEAMFYAQTPDDLANAERAVDAACTDMQRLENGKPT